MDIPVELQPNLVDLTAHEIDELEAWFANLPIYDEEIRSLIATNLDALTRELRCMDQLAA